MRRRHRKDRDLGAVEMNLAAMLDMAFQLLTFFILTFRPAPIEGQLAVHLPEPASRQLPDPDNLAPDIDGDWEKTLHLQVTADRNGGVRQVTVEKSLAIDGPMDAANVRLLDKKLHSIFAVEQIPYDRTQIAVDGQLQYGELMKIVDVCSRQQRSDGDVIKKISFTQL